MFSIYSSNIPPKCVKHDPGTVACTVYDPGTVACTVYDPGYCPCCPGVHSIEADARYTDAMWEHYGGCTGKQLLGKVAASLAELGHSLGASGWVTGEWGTRGAEAWACSPRVIEVKTGSEWRPAYPGSHEQCSLGSAPSVCYSSGDHWRLCLLSLPPFFSGGHKWALLPCIGGTLKSRPTATPRVSAVKAAIRLKGINSLSQVPGSLREPLSSVLQVPGSLNSSLAFIYLSMLGLHAANKAFGSLWEAGKVKGFCIISELSWNWRPSVPGEEEDRILGFSTRKGLLC